MIKLKSLLLEHINDYSWLSPTGIFYPTDDHERTARHLLKQMQLSQMDRDGINYISYELMYKFKYLRITNIKNSFGGKNILATNRLNSPTNEQIRVLINFAIEHNYDAVIYVKDKTEYFTIWDKSHQLE